MRLPFVSRAIYDDARADLVALRLELAKERERVESLTRVIIDMKVTGATIRQAVNGTMGLKLEAREPSELDKALDENDRTRRNRTLRSRMRAWAEDAMAKPGADDDAILDRVRHWNAVPVDGEDETDEGEEEAFA